MCRYTQIEGGGVLARIAIGRKGSIIDMKIGNRANCSHGSESGEQWSSQGCGSESVCHRRDLTKEGKEREENVERSDSYQRGCEMGRCVVASWTRVRDSYTS